MEKNMMEKELMEFLKYIKEVHVDDYGHLEICDSGDELDPTVERVVKEYMKSKNIEDRRKKKVKKIHSKFGSPK
jgi:hypothetical protein